MAYGRRAYWTFVGLIAVIVGAALAALGPYMAPVRPGSPALFWDFACGLDLSGKGRARFIPFGKSYYIDSEWVAYEDQGLHGSKLYCVRVSEVLVRFDAVIAELERKQKLGEDSVFVQGYAAWTQRTRDARGVEKLLESINAKLNERFAARGIDSLAYAIAEEQQFWQRWQRAKWYWANFVFEWTFLTGLALFAVWPGIFRQGPFRWALHVAALPFTFMLPAYLGYASWSFTSAGPSGGILYPFLLLITRGGRSNRLDVWLLEHTPQILEPISTPTGSYLSISGGGMAGPTTTVILGLVLGAVTFGVAHALRRRGNGRAQ